ncbi:hypothetical protein N9L68_04955 [bacterium]|nr:hypothetical protein [bacterium]
MQRVAATGASKSTAEFDLQDNEVNINNNINDFEHPKKLDDTLEQEPGIILVESQEPEPDDVVAATSPESTSPAAEEYLSGAGSSQWDRPTLQVGTDTNS